MSYFPPPTALQVRDTQSGNEGKITINGAQVVAELTRLAGGTFDGAALSDIFWQKTLTGSGYATVAEGVLRIGTGVTANSRMMVTSFRVARYLTGNTNSFLAGARFTDTGGPNLIKRLGVFDAQNGYFIEQNGGAIRVIARKSGVDQVIAHSAFTNQGGFVHDNKYHTYLIEYSANRVYFFQDNRLFHWVTSDLAVLTATMHLRIGFEALNINGATTDHAVEVRTASVSRQGQARSRPIYHLIPNTQVTGQTLKSAPSTLHKVLVGTRGSMGSYIDIFDSATAGTNQVGRIDTYNNIGALSCDLDFYNGLSYSCTANSGWITLIFD